ncbi:hypothetical protein [Nonomuraea basaltis]|uniref:hypothetical protein n=1 Tax=Nonomuraea basaltis TaxID=2495887 RepID=UPI00110C4D61|nr:hypothetical protein [Nonomuraea basaltis]TMR93131.1 hypothetical protein EJK15_40755 [Nonomuraea basaltis]
MLRRPHSPPVWPWSAAGPRPPSPTPGERVRARTSPGTTWSPASSTSTKWLFEGDDRALLVDTAINTPEVIGANDLKTVVRYLLGHEDDGTERSHAVDFDVAITHHHGDHTGKVSQISGAAESTLSQCTVTRLVFVPR